MKKIKYLIAAAGIACLILTTPTIYSHYTQVKHKETQEHTKAQKTVIDITTAQQLEAIIAKNEKVAVDIGATWCGPCEAYAPVFKEVAEEYKGQIVFCKVLLDKIDNKEHRKISEKYLIRYIPKTLLFKNEKEVHNRVGGMEKQELTKLIDTYLLEKNNFSY